MGEDIASTTRVQLPPSSSFLRRAGGTAETCSGKNSNDAHVASGKEISGAAGSLWTIYSFKRLSLLRGTRWSHSHMLYSKGSATEEAGMVGRRRRRERAVCAEEA